MPPHFRMLAYRLGQLILSFRAFTGYRYHFGRQLYIAFSEYIGVPAEIRTASQSLKFMSRRHCRRAVGL